VNKLTNVVDPTKTVDLPDDIFFDNEFDQPTVRQSSRLSIGGKHIHQRGQTFKGRKIALTGTESIAWLARKDVVIVQQMANTALNEQYELTLGDKTYSVIFDYENAPFVAKPVVACSDPNDESWYTFSINLITV